MSEVRSHVSRRAIFGAKAEEKRRGRDGVEWAEGERIGLRGSTGEKGEGAKEELVEGWTGAATDVRGRSTLRARLTPESRRPTLRTRGIVVSDMELLGG